VLKILCLHIAENQASYRYRVEQFLPYWQEYDIEMHPISIVGKSYFQKIKLALQSKRYDYVWLQRKPLSNFLISLITARSRLVYDYDDALYARQSHHYGVLKSTQPGSPQMVSRINTILQRSAIVFAGSEALVSYASKFNPFNTILIPTAYGKVFAEPVYSVGDAVTVGWIGSNGNMHYLRLIDDAVMAMQVKYPFVRFSVMSGTSPEGLNAKWDFVLWSKEREDAWLRSIDIGIMPLEDDEWSKGKCAFKLLQYMAYGKPVIASAVGANYAAVQHGVSGYLASTSEEWTNAFHALFNNHELRYSMGKASLHHFLSTYERQTVQAQIASILHRYHPKK